MIGLISAKKTCIRCRDDTRKQHITCYCNARHTFRRKLVNPCVNSFFWNAGLNLVVCPWNKHSKDTFFDLNSNFGHFSVDDEKKLIAYTRLRIQRAFKTDFRNWKIPIVAQAKSKSWMQCRNISIFLNFGPCFFLSLQPVEHARKDRSHAGLSKKNSNNIPIPDPNIHLYYFTILLEKSKINIRFLWRVDMN